MWIFLGVVLALTILITIVLLLPISIIIKSNSDEKFTFKFKLLFKTFESKGEEKSSIGATLEKLIGADKLQKNKLKHTAKEKGFGDTLQETLSLFATFFKELVGVLGHCTAKRFKITVLCRGDDAAAAAIKYGRYCSIIYPAAGLISSIIKVKKKGLNINVTCDYTEGKDEFTCDFLIKVRIFRVLGAFLRIAIKHYAKKKED